MAKRTSGTQGTDTDQPATKPKRRWLRRTVLAVLIVAIIGAVTPPAIVGIASSSRMYTVDTVEPHDVVIVFGAGLKDGKPSLYLTARLTIARDLFKAGKAKVILVSGDGLYESHNEPAAMTEWLIDQGIPADKIVADYAGEDTYATCYRARAIFGVTSAILVSQTYHLPRAVTTCRLVGVDVVGIGDESVRATTPDLWGGYQFREILADYNMVAEVVTGRKPILGDPEDGVRVALGH